MRCCGSRQGAGWPSILTRTMSGTSQIEWTGRSWKTIAGCTAVSPGCTFCYAVWLAKRYRGRAVKQGLDSPYLDVVPPPPGDGHDSGAEATRKRHFTGVVHLLPESLTEPYTWTTPCPVFVNSESDTLHEKVPDDWVRAMFEVMGDEGLRPWWFQVLTKRSERLRELGPTLPWTDNVWPGVTIESNDFVHRVDDLRACGAPHCWLSLEPLLGPLDDLDVTGIDWVIVGGEAGNGGRKDRAIREEWVQDIYAKCREAGVPMFVKQWGHRKYNPLTIEGRADPSIAAGTEPHGKGGCMLRPTPRSKPRVVREAPSQWRHFFG